MAARRSSSKGKANLSSNLETANAETLKAPGSRTAGARIEQPPDPGLVLDFDPALHLSNLALLQAIEEASKDLSDSEENSADFSPSELCRDDPQLLEEIKHVKRAVESLPAEVRFPLGKNQQVEEATGKQPEARNTAVRKQADAHEDPAEGLKIMAKGYAKAWAEGSKTSVGGSSAKLKKSAPDVKTGDRAIASGPGVSATGVSVTGATRINNEESLAGQSSRSNAAQMEEILPECVELWEEVGADTSHSRDCPATEVAQTVSVSTHPPIPLEWVFPAKAVRGVPLRWDLSARTTPLVPLRWITPLIPLRWYLSAEDLSAGPLRPVGYHSAK